MSRLTKKLRCVLLSYFGFVVFILLNVYCVFGSETEWPELTLDSSDRILILAPHPDDEVIACSGIIQKAVALQLPVRVVFFTYGDNNQWSFLVYRKHPVLMPKAVKTMGSLRHDEAMKASKEMGISPDNLIFLGYPDFGTMTIWDAHWGNQPPYKSMLTQARMVPYEDALRPGAPYKGEEIIKDLKKVIQDYKPTKIFLSHPADHNGDHRSLYLFTRVALWDLGEKIDVKLFPYLVHFKGWPRPKGLKINNVLEPPAALREQIAWSAYRLSKGELDHKLKALKTHGSQYRSSAKYLLSFVRSNELFGDFPTIQLLSNEFRLSLPKEDFSPLFDIPDQSQDTSEELTGEERGAFVGLESRLMRIENNNLVFSIQLSRPIGKGVEASIYFFGYRNDIPFADMPKIHVRVGVLKYAIYNQNRKISSKTISVNHRAKEISITVPLSVLGNPQRILTSARTYLGNVPLDWVSWRILEIPRKLEP